MKHIALNEALTFCTHFQHTGLKARAHALPYMHHTHKHSYTHAHVQVVQSGKAPSGPGAALEAEGSASFLPPLVAFPEGHHASAPVFQAKGPIATFPSNASVVC